MAVRLSGGYRLYCLKILKVLLIGSRFCKLERKEGNFGGLMEILQTGFKVWRLICKGSLQGQRLFEMWLRIQSEIKPFTLITVLLQSL